MVRSCRHQSCIKFQPEIISILINNNNNNSFIYKAVLKTKPLSQCLIIHNLCSTFLESWGRFTVTDVTCCLKTSSYSLRWNRSNVPGAAAPCDISFWLEQMATFWLCQECFAMIAGISMRRPVVGDKFGDNPRGPVFRWWKGLRLVCVSHSSVVWQTHNS